MTQAEDILRLRLRRQQIEHPTGTDTVDPAEVVRHLCAMQAQDYAGVLWAVGLRSVNVTEQGVEQAVAERRIIRTWPLRGTLHLVAPEDVRWMLELTAPHVVALATTRHSQLGLTEEVFARAREIFTENLKGGGVFTRSESLAALEAEGVLTSGQRGSHILWTLSQQAVLCIGPMKGNEQTFVLFDDWVPPTGEKPLERNEALARLAARYFAGHGPATLEDFEWWAGVTSTEAQRGLDAVAHDLEQIVTSNDSYWVAPDTLEAAYSESRPTMHLLPGFDEYMLGYTDRGLQLDDQREAHGSIVTANEMSSPTLLIDGQIAGTWKRTIKDETVDIGLRTFRALTALERETLAIAAEQYGNFLGKTAVLGDWAGGQLR